MGDKIVCSILVLEIEFVDEIVNYKSSWNGPFIF